jgi:uncharacterized damage-inducible protein DinB
MNPLRIATAIAALCLANCCPASAQTAENPLSQHARWMYAGVKHLVLRSAEKMPEENFSFKPAESVRTYAQILGHIADWQYTYCSIVRGERRMGPGNEKKTSKAELIAGIKEAFAYCDDAYNTLTDASATQIIKLGTHTMPKLGVLTVNNIHSTEHYGNLITYMRIKNIVPPSSEPGFNVPMPKQ